ncbi:alkyl sulfatase C-terminal domain-containing protein [Streptomyces chartreusis]
MVDPPGRPRAEEPHHAHGHRARFEHDVRAQRDPGVRLAGHPRQRPTRLGREAQHPVADHRPGSDLPHGAVNGALIHHPDPKDTRADLTLTLTKPQLLGLLAGRGLDGIEHEGDVGVLTRLLGLLDEPDPDFAIVTP